jgi:hypothetical protein
MCICFKDAFEANSPACACSAVAVLPRPPPALQITLYCHHDCHASAKRFSYG